MTLSIKTPAQVLQEYQNRNRGVSINYNTVAIERNGTKLFKTIVTAGSTAAEVRLRWTMAHSLKPLSLMLTVE